MGVLLQTLCFSEASFNAFTLVSDMWRHGLKIRIYMINTFKYS